MHEQASIWLSCILEIMANGWGEIFLALLELI
jgi:hypothetical protein